MEIRGDLLLELLSSELKFMEQRKSQSERDLEEVGYRMDFREELLYYSESWKVSEMWLHLRQGQILITIDAPRSSACRSRQKGSRKSIGGKRPLNVLSSS